MCTNSRAQKQKAHKSALRVIISKLEVNRVVGMHCFRCGSHLVSLSSVYKCWSGRNLRCVFIHVYRVNCYLLFYFFFLMAETKGRKGGWLTLKILTLQSQPTKCLSMPLLRRLLCVLVVTFVKSRVKGFYLPNTQLTLQ